MRRSLIALGALFPLCGVANAETIKIGSGEFQILSAEKILEGRMIIYSVDLKYTSSSGTANVRSVVYCTTKQGEYYDTNDRMVPIKIRKSAQKTSITNYIFFKYCPGSKGMTKKELETFGKYD